METKDLIDRIYNYAEAGEVDKAVIACHRLAGKIGDTFNVIMFLRELRPDTNQLKISFAHETQNLNEEARDRLWKETQDCWIAERTYDYSLDPDDEDKKLLVLGVGQLKAEIQQIEKSIEDLHLPGDMDEFDLAAFTDRNRALKGEMRLKIRACTTIIERIRTRCLDYAHRIERQLEAGNKNVSIITFIQNNVHNYYASHCDTVFQSLLKASSLLNSSNAEDHALLLTSVRRAMKAAADFHYPPVTHPVVCRDGNIRNLGEEQYLNRLQEFCACQFDKDKLTELLQAELDVFSTLLRRLNDIASKGVHAQVSRLEAHQGLIGAYTVLSTIVEKLEYCA